MEHHSSKALILRVKDLGESDLLVLFFTPDQGLLKGVAKAARKSRRRFVNCLDYFCLSLLEYHRRRENQLFMLDSCKLIQGFERLRADYRLLTYASYFAELTETLFPLNVKAQGMFQLLVNCFDLLCEGIPADKVVVLFQGRAMALGGYAIAFDRCADCKRPYKGEGRAVFVPERGGISCLRCRKESKNYPAMDPESVRVLREIQDTEHKLTSLPPLSDNVVEELKKVLDQHVAYRLGKRLKTRKYIG